ncbi:MAG: FkbM family methyltransferase [Burkholderiales bacterium]
MKEVKGWYLPDEDTHFEGYFEQAQTSEYQSKQRECALKYCDNFRLALDVGAHVGLWARPLTERFKSVQAFEPYPPYAQLLELNAPAAVIHRQALGEKRGPISLETPKENSGAAYVKEGSSHQMRSLDSYNFKDVDFIKIDCEGYELPVILGAADTLRMSSPVLIVEQKPQKKGWPWGRYDALSLLQDFGYKIVDRVIDDWVMKK